MTIKENFIARQDFTHRYIREFNKVVSPLRSYVYIGDEEEDRLANAKSIIGVFSLQIGKRSDFKIVIINDNEEAARMDLEVIKNWFRSAVV